MTPEQIIQDAFDNTNIDPEIWDKLDRMDDGERINISLTVCDLKRIRGIVKEK